MLIKPKYKGFICTTAHPVGCKENVTKQIDYLKGQKKFEGAKKVLVIGASAGFGLASRMVLSFCGGASTIGVFFERPFTDKRSASSGWYNTAAFEEMAVKEGLYAKSINGDAFSNDIKAKTVALIKRDLKEIDLVVYSLASPRRVHPITGETLNSTLKPIDKEYTGKTVDMHTKEVSNVTIQPANQKEIDETVDVMGGEDWRMWMEYLEKENVLAKGVNTIAYSYIGPKLTHPIYKDGTIGKAKDNLQDTCSYLDDFLKKLGGVAHISVNKALVTQASSAIPVVPLYISLVYKIMKEKGLHEDCTKQMYRLFNEMYSNELNLDDLGRIRIDNLEMRSDVQEEVDKLWDKVSTSNVEEITDITGYKKEFFNLFGFEVDGIDYDEEVDIKVGIPSLE